MGHTFDRVLLARHFALCAGAAAAYVLRSELQIGYTALWIVALSAILNFSAYVFRTRAGMARICFVASPIIGVGGWAALIAVTGGVSSPFIAGLWLEIVLSAMAMDSAGVIAVTIGSFGVLWAQQFWLGVPGRQALLSTGLQSGFLVGMGLATFLVTRRWIRAQDTLSERHAELSDRLGDLAQALEDERTLSEMGEQVARLAHGLKNAVHSLRGFVSLIEPRLGADDDRPALDGLRAAIDDLEVLARATLESTRERPGAGTPPDAPGRKGALVTIERALRELAISHPGVEWVSRTQGGNPDIPLRPDEFLEILLILMGNAAEAMKGQGHASIDAVASASEFRVRIHDEGTGFSAESIPKLFKRGYTTKPGGNGYGLFLARRILEQHGGQLDLKAGEPAGATVEVTIPLTSNPRRDAAAAEAS